MQRRFLVFVLVLVTCVGCDHAVKQAAVEWLAPGSVIALLGGIVHFQLVSNEGAFLSLGASLPEPLRHVLLIGLVPLVLAALAGFVWRSPAVSRSQVVALGLVAGGGFANWLDRVLDDGAVTDFVSLGLGALRTGIFNLADVAIVFGVLLLLRGGAALREEARTPS